MLTARRPHAGDRTKDKIEKDVKGTEADNGANYRACNGRNENKEVGGNGMLIDELTKGREDRTHATTRTCEQGKQ